MDNASVDDQQDRTKLIVAYLLPNLKAYNNIFQIFIFLSCKNNLRVRSLCIHELTEMILEIDQKRFSREELVKIYE